MKINDTPLNHTIQTTPEENKSFAIEILTQLIEEVKSGKIKLISLDRQINNTSKSTMPNGACRYWADYKLEMYGERWTETNEVI